MALIGFIGVGNMGYPMFLNAVEAFGKENVIYTDAGKERCEYVKNETGIDYKSSNTEVVSEAKYIVLGIKYQYFEVVFKEIKEYLTSEHILISPAPGITIDEIKADLGGVKVVRAMPNTPAMVGEGMTGISFSDDSYTEEEKGVLNTFFTSFGKYEVFEERLMNAVVCANGSSPAYVYLFIEALADSVVKYGIPRDKAYTLTAQTVLGAAKMVLETKEHPAKLKDNVCSPGGTTIAAITALEEYGFRNAIMKATDACYEKTTSIKK